MLTQLLIWNVKLLLHLTQWFMWNYYFIWHNDFCETITSSGFNDDGVARVLVCRTCSHGFKSPLRWWFFFFFYGHDSQVNPVLKWVPGKFRENNKGGWHDTDLITHWVAFVTLVPGDLESSPFIYLATDGWCVFV